MPARRMRPVSREEGLQKLRSLRCFPEVRDRILQGWGMPELARFIQEDRNEYTHASRVSLAQVLQRFKDTIPVAELAGRRIPAVAHEAAKKLEEGLDELKELEELYRMHKERLQIDFTIEKGVKKLTHTMVQEIRVGKELLQAMMDIKMDLGLVTRHNGQSDVQVTIQTDTTRYGKESVKKVMESPEKRRKVLNIAERILALPSRTERTGRPESDDAGDAAEWAALKLEEDDESGESQQ